jgi:hypothetical protein
MKKIIITLVLAGLTLLTTHSDAGTWCMWNGTQGVHCQLDTKGYVRLPGGHPVSAVPAPGNLNQHGFYALQITYPALGENQTYDAEVWGLTDNVMTKTWTVRDLTGAEIDERSLGVMPIGQYYLWRALIAKGVITQQEAAMYLPAELIEAYLARKRIKGD